MKVFYYSCHGVLEADEVGLLKGLGHDVCAIGTRSSRIDIHPYRPFIELSAVEEQLYDLYEGLGGSYTAPFWEDAALPTGFRKILMLPSLCIKPATSKYIGRN